MSHVPTGAGRKYHTFRSILVIGMLICLLVPSRAAGGPPEENPITLAIRLASPGTSQSVRLQEGQTLLLELESNPSTGYRWELHRENDSGTGDTILLPIDEPVFESASDLLGRPAVQKMRFVAVGEGKQDYRLEYRRAWEEDQEPLRSVPLQVEGAGPFIRDYGEQAQGLLGTAPDYPLPTLSGDPRVQSLPGRFNWCEQGGCTPIKAQGNCGSCWTFSTVGALECNIKIWDGVTKNLAEQYLLSCNMNGWGCNGGWFAHDYHLNTIPPGEPDAGAVNESSFPYWGYKVACNPPHTHHEKITSWSYVVNSRTRPAVADIKKAIYDYGPVSAAVCTGWRFDSYSGGIFEQNECQDTDHAIVLVGWDDNQGTQGIWYLRNSWGTYWGESGYMRIGYGISNVGYGTNYLVYGAGRPANPANLAATPITATRTVDLSWADHSDNETGFSIERSLTGTGHWDQIATVGSNVTAYADPGRPDGPHFYRVRAYDAGGDYSGYTNVSCAAFGLDPAANLPLVWGPPEHRLLEEKDSEFGCENCGSK